MTPLWQDRVEYEIHPPTAPDAPFLVLAHPHPLFGGTMHNKVIDQVFRRASEREWGVLRFNFRGAGRSAGAHDEGRGETDDLVALLTGDLLPSSKALILIGYSFGSWILERALPKIERPILRVLLIAPPTGRYEFPPGLRPSIPTTVFAAEKDELIPLERTRAFFAGLPEPKRLEIIEGADHYFIGTTTKLVRAVFADLEGAA